jgi:hypothetical protein
MEQEGINAFSINYCLTNETPPSIQLSRIPVRKWNNNWEIELIGIP